VNALWPKSGTGKIFICIPAYASVWLYGSSYTPTLRT
jgi:hypothetical protein